MKGETGDFKQLVTGAGAGDLRAFERLVRRFRNLAFGYAYSILGDCQLAEDATQEAFLEAHRLLPRLRHPAAFPGWLRLIVFKHADRITRRATVLVVPLDDSPEVVAPGAGPDELAERRETKERVLDAVRDLPEGLRTATALFYIGGHSVVEISQYLEVPVTTVKKRLHDARKHLREAMMDTVGMMLKDRALPEEFARRLVMFPFPRREPPVEIEDLPRERFRVRCIDAQAFFVPLMAGGKCDWTFYDWPGGRLTGVNESHVIGASKWKGGTLVRAWFRYADLTRKAASEWGQEYFQVGKEAHVRVELGRTPGGKIQLSEHAWPGEPEDPSKQVLMNLGIGPSPKGYEQHEITGVSRVTVGDRSWTCLKVVMADQRCKSPKRAPTILAEWYVAKNGRTVFFRRYNGPHFTSPDKPTSFESLKGNLEVRWHGVTFRHAYDCIPDIALGKPF